MMKSSSSPGAVRLITFPPSNGSEVGRWVLDHFGIPFKEEPHTSPFFFFKGVRHSSPIPILMSKKVKLEGDRQIIDHYNSQSPPELKLLPENKAERDEVESLWQLYRAEFGAPRVWAYYNLLSHRSLMIEPLTRNVPRFQKWFVKNAYWLSAGFLRLALRLTAKRAEESLIEIRRIYDHVEKRLADGRKYLMGDRFTLADLAFAVNGGSVLLLDQRIVPTFAESPPEMKKIVEELRQSEAGQFILRLYREERHRVSLTSTGSE